MATDKWGNVIPDSSATPATPQTPQAQAPTPTASPVDKWNVGPSLTVRPREQVLPEVDKAFSQQEGNILDPAMPYLPMVLGTVGMALGPGVSAAGMGLGSAINTKYQGGTIPEAVGSGILSGGLGYGMGQVLNAAGGGKISQALLATILGKAAKTGLEGEQPPQTVEEQVVDLGKDFGLNLGINLAAGKFSDIKSGKARNEPLGKAAENVRANLEAFGPQLPGEVPPKSTAEYGAEGIKLQKAQYKKSLAAENALYKTFREQHAEPNVVEFDKLVGYETGRIIDPKTGVAPQIPKFERVKVNGPIYTANTQLKAAEVMPELEGFIKGEVFQKLPPAMQAKYQKLYTTIKDLATPLSAYANGKPVDVPIKEWETVKDIRTQINGALGGKPDRSFPEAGLKKVADTLGTDIDFSISNFWKDGAKASKVLADANAAHQFTKKTFNKEFREGVYGKYEAGKLDTRVPADPSQFFKDIFKSPEKVDRAMQRLGPENVGVLKKEYFDNELMKKGFGPNYSKFKPDKIINELEDPNSISRRVMTADERNNVLQFARAAKNASGGSLGFDVSGKVALNLGVGASRLLTGSTVPARLLIDAGEWMEQIKDQKIVSNLAQRMIKIRPESAESQANAKLLLRSLRGMQMQVAVGDRIFNAIVGDNGKLQAADAPQ